VVARQPHERLAERDAVVQLGVATHRPLGRRDGVVETTGVVQLPRQVVEQPGPVG
jgi:hypothetical protein